MAALTLLLSGDVAAQSDRVSWKRSPSEPASDMVVFHSDHVIGLPTAATFQKGTFQFEITHRFTNPVSTGYETLYGLDGPANIRLGLGYALSESVTLTLGRSNLRGNVDLKLKWKFHGPKGSSVPLSAAVLLGGAWDTNSELHDTYNHRSFQWFAQLVVNAGVARGLALGLVPSYVGNSIPPSEDVEHAMTMGLYGQYYLTRIMSLMLEWNIMEPGYFLKHDAFGFGMELETGGHFFKLIFTNSTFINTTQYLPGTVYSQKPEEWRFGFNITRLLKF